jgi:hypothetical protein
MLVISPILVKSAATGPLHEYLERARQSACVAVPQLASRDAADFKTLPDPKTRVRFGDAQYALAPYLYSLESPPAPNKPDAVSASR